ncbi:hypothetical protein BC629DRAFT_1592295 [Irpex lacteus]|nr:hypothetical protein BC629DRAFT_1592295 [Irpex lacteus]
MAMESTAGQNGSERLEPMRYSEGSGMASDGTQYASYPSISLNDAERPEMPSALPSYVSEKEGGPWSARTPNAPLISPEPEKDSAVVVKQWVPIPLRPVFWVPLVLLMAGGGIAFEVALHFSKKNHDIPPVAISMIFAGLWAWMDIEIRRIQVSFRKLPRPSVRDLAKGNAPPQRSLLLDYTRNHTFYVWTVAARNNHYLVTLASLLVIITFSFQPLSAALFNVQDVFWLEPLMCDWGVRSTSTSLASIGLNQDGNFQDLSSFLTAAGYASANVRYGVGDPAFIHQGYTVAPFLMPPHVSNGTVTANTTAVRSEPNCIGPEMWSKCNSWRRLWNNTATFNGCSFSWNATILTRTQAWTSYPTPPNVLRSPPSPSNSARHLLVLTYQPSAMASISLCSPNITVEDVTASIDIASGNVTSVTSLGPLGSHVTSLQQFPDNVTATPRRARIQGMFFALSSPDPFQQQRQNAIQLSLPAAVFQAAQNAPEGLTDAFQNNKFANLSSAVYTTYLALVAKTVYFLDFQQPIEIDTQTIHKRLFLSNVAVHLLASAMFVLAVFGTILQIWHRRESSILRLTHAPGTIASAVSLGGKTGLGEVLAGRLRQEDMLEALRNRRFRIDTRTMKIVMEGEDGYEDAVTPDAYRTAFGGIGLGHVGEWSAGVGRRLSRRLSAWNPTKGEHGAAPSTGEEASGNMNVYRRRINDYASRKSGKSSRSSLPGPRETAGNRLPVELLLQVFVRIPELVDVLHCRAACKQFKQIIDETPEMRYHIELRVLGYEDNDSHTLPGASARLEALEARQRWWRSSHSYTWNCENLGWVHFNFITNQYYDNLWLRCNLDTSRLTLDNIPGVGGNEIACMCFEEAEDGTPIVDRWTCGFLLCSTAM